MKLKILILLILGVSFTSCEYDSFNYIEDPISNYCKFDGFLFLDESNKVHKNYHCDNVYGRVKIIDNITDSCNICNICKDYKHIVIK